jgi:hypothetical protein
MSEEARSGRGSPVAPDPGAEEEQVMMDQLRPDELGETPTLEVIVYRDGELVERVRCETELEAAEIVASREETVGVECVVTDLSTPPLDEAAIEVEPLDDLELYPVDAGEEDRVDLDDR